MRGSIDSVVIGALIAAIPGWVCVHAQPVVRLEPFPVHYDGVDRVRRRTISIWVDGIPAPGLGSFRIGVDSRPRDEDTDELRCVYFEKADIDPDLKAAWRDAAGTWTSTLDGNTVVIWSAWAANQGSTPLPRGTIRLGSLVFVGRKSCPDQGEFRLSEDISRWDSSTSPSRPFDGLKGAPWIWGPLPDLDLVATCDRTSPQGGLVDGNELILECLVSNLGATGFGQVPPLFMAVFSEDESFDLDLDREIVRSVGAGIMTGGRTAGVTLSARPVATTPGVVNICTKIDTDISGLDQGWGVRWEIDETNNTECQPITILPAHRDMIVVPGSVNLTPDPRDPDGLYRAGLSLQVSYDVLNRGNGAVRREHINRVLLGASFSAAAVDPNAELCTARVDPNDGLPLLGGGLLAQSFGLGHGISPNRCKIPFRYPPGPQNLYIQIDSDDNVLEDDPNQIPDPAEINNVVAVPITVSKPRDPEFRVQHNSLEPADQRVEIFGPATETMLVAVASATGLTSYGFDLGWAPVELLSLGDPNIPGGDATQVRFRSFLEEGGLVPACSVTSVDPAAGRLSVQCSTSDPSGTGTAAWTESSRPILAVTFTPLLPGGGTFTISSLSASDGAGQPFSDLRISNGTFFINGVPELFVLDPVPAPAAWPGVDFHVSFDLMNDGFGRALPPLLTELIVSRDAFNDPLEAFSPDLRACVMGETVPLPGKTTVGRTLVGCRIRENIRPGLYTSFFQVQDLLDTSRRSSAVIPFPARLLVLGESSSGRLLEVRRHPTAQGVPAGPAMVSTKNLPAQSVVSVKSEARNRNWMVRLHRPRGKWGRLFVDQIPTELDARLETLRDLRVAHNVREVLAGADIDGDGEDELMLLLRSEGGGEQLDFRRIDYTAVFPAMCPSAAISPGLHGGVVAAAGIQVDADPEDEIAVVARDGVLTLYDVELEGPVPPAEPCLFTPRPLSPRPPAVAALAEIASDTGFSAPGDWVRSLCALDFDLDGTDEIASLHLAADSEPGGTRTRAGSRGRARGHGPLALRVYDPPASMGGSAILLAEDPEFSSSRGPGRALRISCTR